MHQQGYEELGRLYDRTLKVTKQSRGRVLVNMGSFVRITVLIWADILTNYALFVMTPYLTNVWSLNITHAAAIVNVFSGAATIMPIGMAFLVDAFMVTIGCSCSPVLLIAL
ncbi:protein nrt1/ ptr family 5.5 [Quercus suber]|uniref:Protein nrt1/ ptr family 5.5 n=1 Tax=Quercus suber TaxID=58331 RepID=A0AAW0IWS1_QUESU